MFCEIKNVKQEHNPYLESIIGRKLENFQTA